MAKVRTIQHPGFEFFETEESKTVQYINPTKALALIYAARGPINTPIKISSLDDYNMYFGNPTTDAEFYSYIGIKSIVDVNGTITVVRLPYDNTLSKLLEFQNSDTKKYVEKRYKAIGYTFDLIEGSTGNFPDIDGVYASKLNYKTLKQTPNIISEDTLIVLSNDQLSNSITNIYGNKFDADFYIINKYQNELDDNNEEIIVSIIGAGNVVRYQDLNLDSENQTPIQLYKSTNFISDFYINDITKLKFGKNKSSWQSNGILDENNELGTVIDDFEPSLLDLYTPLTTTDVYNNSEKIGMPNQTIYFSTTENFDISNPDNITPKVISLSENVHSVNDDEIVGITGIQYGTVNASGTDVSENVGEYPTSIQIGPAFIKIKRLANLDTDNYSEYDILEQSEYILYKTKDNTPDGIVTESYNLKRYADTTSASSTQNKYYWTYEIKAEYNKDAGENYYVSNKFNDKITVVVSKIKKSKLEIGTYIPEIIEVFNGSVFKNSVDQITNESNYIGDIINSSSNYISFYGKTNYNTFDKNTDLITITDFDTYRLSIVNGGLIFEPNMKLTEDNINEYKSKNPQNVFDIKKRFVRSEIAKSSNFNYLIAVVGQALSTVKNNNNYTFRDFYDFGCSSIYAYMSEDGYGDLIYNVNNSDPSESSSFQYLNSRKWKQYVKLCSRFCQYDHKLVLFHADGPRKLVLNGNYSRADDLEQDQNSVIFTNKKIQTISIKDSTYVETNVMWWEVVNPITNKVMWVPNSTKLIAILTSNDIAYNIWTPPAGHNYGIINNVKRPAFNPNEASMNLLYSNCLNYASAWASGYVTLEGQKTGLIENSALNRINVRRLMIYLERYVKTVSSKYLYTQNTAETRVSFLNEVQSEFNRCKANGGLMNFRIVCNEQNNPQSVIDNNELRITLMVQPTRVLEFIVCNFVVARSGTNLEELNPIF